jgi:hypothetical protein
MSGQLHTPAALPHPYPLDRKLVKPQSWFGRYGEVIILDTAVEIRLIVTIMAIVISY